MSVEDQIKLRVLDDDRIKVEKAIDQQSEKKARLQCQLQLLKLQLVNLMKQQDVKTSSILEKLRDIKEKDLPPISEEQQRKISLAFKSALKHGEDSSDEEGEIKFQDDDIISHSDAGNNTGRGRSGK
ncbi:hypothetical protein FGO68_gene15091 [Halteria grandinella]|uniref:Uncharacterized protein n=1 Tax=Halteria grandinella TaxID=5974 RepID=A0A8J8T982_HALGN|nr:hypothetical protein FGO68_gene15091 [Halteria grandinella]